MSKSHVHEFNDAVWAAAGRLGTMSAPKVTDEIIADLFPGTVNSASQEGASSIFRNGVLAQVRKALSSKIDDDGQMSIFDIDPLFRPFAEKLKKGAYYVKHLDEFVSLPRLIKEVLLLDDARRYLRRKGEETLAEANVLDQLYKAASAANDNTPQKIAA
ncbi:hypothetical protein [Agrobacterium pusense]|uniref:hypothetical protein n=1 Tax=Agrobacterium pusense TaxID=648995 RepID=UPI000514704C|nr:hypothetical protein [Agrobacterium pusense]ANV24493.1 hypothetical protein BA939_11465 [Rhizobium sp. S41]KGE81486.1 hypothetical protein LW14_17780 [Rhizobium sp. H41]QWW74152.1 hypothetical protein KP800_01180 [Agrobacterium pusense]